MNIITETKQVIGTVKVANGLYTFPVLLNGNSAGVRNPKIGQFAGCWQFMVIDDEGFENWITVNGPFLYVPNTFPVFKEVKVALTSEEVTGLDKIELFSDEPVSK